MRKPGRKRSKYVAYVKRRLSSDARIIVALLRKQPLGKDELCKRAGVPLSTFYRICRMLEDLGILKEIAGGGYALWTYSEIEKNIEDALLRLIKRGCSFTVEDLCNEVGKPWSEIEAIAYAVLKKHNLKIRTVNGRKSIQGWQ